MSNTHQFMLGLLAQTSIHAGADSSTSVIDLPIQREGHSDIPCVFGSSVKGALRARAEAHYINGEEANVTQVFGSEHSDQASKAGALSVGDARLLLLPVRSLTTQFKWVTCPMVIDRYMRDRELLNLQGAPSLTEGFDFSDDSEKAYIAKKDHSSTLFLEEYRYNLKEEQGLLEPIIQVIAKLMKRDRAADELAQQLVVVSNDAFTYLAKHATPVNPHIAIESSTKIVRSGALWYEESLPPDTLFYVPLMVNAERIDHDDVDAMTASAQDNAKIVTNLFQGDGHPWLQIGGNETTGMGWFAVAMEGE